ncbi:unnamed protein product [Orchesella dallaii]|uniref:Uncharacterized protein n=1 Tax=Orchesella dallaii TaxID=48710 RepID=A0ABP1RM70_9HEXA
MERFSIKNTLIILTFLISILEHFQTEGNKCDEDTFYLPYVRIKRKKNGADVATLRSSGFLDLRIINRALLCANGPVIMYTDVEKMDPEAKLLPGSDQTMMSLQQAPQARNVDPGHLVSSSGKEGDLRFKGAILQVFNHNCISFNKVPTDLLKKMKEEQDSSTPEILPDTQVMGNHTVQGVYLIGNKEGHNKPELAWFKGPEWEYIKTKETTVKDASFIMTKSDTPHCIRLPDGTHVKITTKPESTTDARPNEVCRWTVKEENKPWYSKIFQRGFDNNGVRNGDPIMDENDYEFYDCPDDGGNGAIILQMSRTTPAPVSHVNFTQFDPFALFNPNMMTPHGYRKDTGGLSGGDEREEDKDGFSGGISSALLCTVTPFHPACSDSSDMGFGFGGNGGSDETETTTMRDMQNVIAVSANNYEILLSDCIPLPVFDKDDCNGIGDNQCRLMELVLELDSEALTPVAGAPPPPAPVPATPGTPPPPPDPEEERKKPYINNLDGDPELKWKMDIINLVSDVFAQLCMPFRPDMPYTIGRVFGWYVYKAHVYGANMGRVGPGGAGFTKDFSDPNTFPTYNAEDFQRVRNKTDTWVILEKELQRCVDVAKKENNGKGLKFQWEIGTDEDLGPAFPVKPVNGQGRKKREASEPQPRRYPVRREGQADYSTSPSKKGKLNPEFSSGWEIDDKNHFEEPIGNDIYENPEDTITVSRQKRAAKVSNKYILPGKNMQITHSEGTSGYAREAIQEYRFKTDLNDPRADAEKYIDYPENIEHCWDPVEDPVTRKVICTKAEDIFFYEDRAELEYELNIAIDLWWKIWATAIGYCNKAYFSRKSETFPRLYNSKYEYFFDLVQKEWKMPEDNEDLRIILSEYLTEESQIWLDTCLEASYINSNSKSYRPPRPMTVLEDGKKEISNYFEELPSFIYYRYHAQNSNGQG